MGAGGGSGGSSGPGAPGGGKGGKNQEGFVPFEFQNLLGQGNQVLGDAIGQSQGSGITGADFFFDPGFLSNIRGLTEGLTGDFGAAGQRRSLALFGEGQESLGRGIDEGFTGGLLTDIESRFRPQLDRAFELGSADIFEQAARTGTTRSSSTVESLGRFRTGLESNLQNILGGIEGQLAPLTAQQRERSTLAALAQPQSFMDLLRGPLREALGESQFLRGLPIQALGATGGLNAVPFVPPIQKGSSPTEQALGFLGPILASGSGEGGKFAGGSAGAGASAGGKGAGGGAASTAGKGAAAACWIARRVFGERDPRWLLVREFVLKSAPKQLRDSYLAIGEQVALDPTLVAQFRPAMEEIVAYYG